MKFLKLLGVLAIGLSAFGTIGNSAILFDQVEMSVSGTPGTSTITLGSAVSTALTFAGAGVADGDVVFYHIQDGSAWENGKGVYNANGTTLSRGLINSSTGSLISASSSADVYITSLVSSAVSTRYPSTVFADVSWLGRNSQPPCALTDGATVNSNVSECVASPTTNSGEYNSLTIAATTPQRVLQLPMGLNPLGGDVVIFDITHAGANDVILKPGSFSYPGAVQPIEWSIAVSGQTDRISCISQSGATSMSCNPVIANIGLIPVPTWTFVASQKAHGANGGTTAAIDAHLANFLVVGVSFQAGASITVSDSSSNTWVQAGSTHSQNNVSNAIYYVYAPTVTSSQTFSCTGTGTFCAVEVEAWTRVAGGTSAIDQSGGAPAHAASLQPGLTTPGFANELVMISLGGDSPEASAAINSGFTANTQDFASSVAYGGALAHLAQTTIVAENPTWTWSGTADAATSIATFR